MDKMWNLEIIHTTCFVHEGNENLHNNEKKEEEEKVKKRD